VNATKKATSKVLTIWTEAYRPFRMGGDVRQPVATEIEVGETISAGFGISLYEITSPHGTTHIIESKSGALVGTNLRQVMTDVRNGGEDVMREQIKRAKKRRGEAELLPSEEFWRLIANNS
jgi:hypothetical protein